MRSSRHLSNFIEFPPLASTRRLHDHPKLFKVYLSSNVHISGNFAGEAGGRLGSLIRVGTRTALTPLQTF